MTTIVATCPECGDVYLTPDQCVVNAGTYGFAHCGQWVQRPNAKAAAVLEACGAIVIDLTTIDEEWKQWSI